MLTLPVDSSFTLLAGDPLDVERYQPLVGEDYRDRPGAGLIVTDNVKDFPSAFLPAGLETQSARDFTTSVASVDPVRAVRASQKIACRHQNPAHPAEDVLDLLVERYRMDGIADILRPLVTEPR